MTDRIGQGLLELQLKAAAFEAGVVVGVEAVLDGGAGAAAGGGGGDFGEDAVVLHFVGEVAAVEFYLKDRFIEILQLREREDFREQLEANGFEVDVLPQPRERHAENLVVVEGQVRDVVPAEPLGLLGIGVGGHFGQGECAEAGSYFHRHRAYCGTVDGIQGFQEE